MVIKFALYSALKSYFYSFNCRSQVKQVFGRCSVDLYRKWKMIHRRLLSSSHVFVVRCDHRKIYSRLQSRRRVPVTLNLKLIAKQEENALMKCVFYRFIDVYNFRCHVHRGKSDFSTFTCNVVRAPDDFKITLHQSCAFFALLQFGAARKISISSSHSHRSWLSRFVASANVEVFFPRQQATENLNN